MRAPPRLLASLALAAGLLALGVTSASADSTLDTVKKRGRLVCGVNGALPGFSLRNAVGEWEGLDVDLCRAVAAAVLGVATRVDFVPLPSDRRFDALRAGTVDMMARNTTVTLQRDAAADIQFAAVNYYDGQAIVVPKASAARELADLRDGSICLTRGSTHELNLQNLFRVRKLSVRPLAFADEGAMYEAFLNGECVAVTQDATALISTFVRRNKAAAVRMLPEIISREPLGPYVRGGDKAWLDVVRWTHNAMVEAEALELTQSNVDRERRESHDMLVRNLLGRAPGNGRALGLDESWAFNVIVQVGNYGESFERNLGSRSPLGLRRGANALWRDGGQMYPLPMR
ncbi:MAG: transporter substrate-binding domain-containing protein [Proteobacteria bacterium]|nr:transporter substrate-binding domain-containing protein [Pseudomonadota bacterium]